MEHMAVFDTNILIDLFNNRVEAADAIILATAQSRSCPLISRNTKDFSGITGVVSPYQL
ncbi:hypothetical protein ACJCHP_004384 [Enterobacter asburiae]|uniref:type II toxin-antitoxin system VapC family toxin n=1 Tax=Enterobacter asburiae TaxID=61645 RepID=UPI0011C39017